MAEPKKQHYVPQTYLKNFTADKKKSRLFVLSKCTEKVYGAEVKDTAAERNFYTIDHFFDKYVLENTYAQCVEPSFGALLKNIRRNCENVLIQNNALVISQAQKTQLALNIVIQLFRGKQARKFEKKLYDELLPSVFDKAKKSFPNIEESVAKKTFERFATDENFFKEIELQTNFNQVRLLNITEILMKYTFVFHRINGAASFVTSDNPVMLINYITKNAVPFTNGLMQSSTILCFPLSPSLLLVAYNPNMFFGVLQKSDCSISFFDDIRDEGFIKMCNRKQLEQCDNYVYSHSKDVLEIISKY